MEEMTLAEDLPAGLHLIALDAGFRADPYLVLRELRERCPVRRDALFSSVHLRPADARGHDGARSVLDLGARASVDLPPPSHRQGEPRLSL